MILKEEQMSTLRHFIDGAWVESTDNGFLVRNSSVSGEPLCRVPLGTAEDADHAVRAASAAQEGWNAGGLNYRLEAISKLANAIEAHAERLAQLEVREMGKPISVSRNFMASGIQALRDAVDDAKTYPFSARVKTVNGMATDIERAPVGVVALIVPWNFTVLTTLMGLGSILAAGNTCVIKPSEKASLSGVGLFEVIEELDLPRGVVNLLLGDHHSGAPLSAHPDIGLVRFTGSVPTGKRVGASAARNLNRSILELGGNDPVVIDSDVNPVETAKAVAVGAFTNSGQICTSMERIYVHEAIAEPFIDALVKEAESLRLGDPFDDSTDLGPMVDDGQRQIVHKHVTGAIASGARLLIGGVLPEGPGCFYPPTVIVDADPSSELMMEETFGPIAPVVVVNDFKEGLSRARATPFGLGATIYSNTPDHIELSKSLPVGILWINEWQGGDFGRLVEAAGESGMGAGGGALALDAATRPMAVHYRVDDSKRD